MSRYSGIGWDKRYPWDNKRFSNSGATPTPPPVQVDWWDNCVFLSHFDGVDEATTALDISTEGGRLPAYDNIPRRGGT